MQIKIDGIEYKSVVELTVSCKGCAFNFSPDSCDRATDEIDCITHDIIWVKKEHNLKEKTNANSDGLHHRSQDYQ